MARVTSNSERVADLVTWGLLDVTWAVMNILTAAYFMLVINPRLALIVLADGSGADHHRHPVPAANPG